MIRLPVVVLEFIAQTDRFNRDIAHSFSMAERAVNQAAVAMRRAGLIAATTVGLFVFAATSEFAKFDRALQQSTAVMSDMTESIRSEMSATASEISRTTTIAADEAARSFFYLASAGYDAVQSLTLVRQVAAFAEAGQFSMARATELLTDAQSALGMSLKDAQADMQNMTDLSDVLVKANTLANATTEQFAKSLTSKAGSALRLVNKDMYEGVAVLAAYADQGVKAELAGERLHIFLRDVQRANLRNRESWELLGVSVFDANEKMRPVADILGQLEVKFANASDMQKRMALQMLGFTDRSIVATTQLLGLSDVIREYEKELRAAEGTTKRVQEEQLKNFGSQMIILGNQIKEVTRLFGEVMAPAVVDLGRAIASLLEQMRALPKWVMEMGMAITIAVGIVGVLAFAMSLAITAVLGLIGAFQIWIAIVGTGVAAATVSTIAYITKLGLVVGATSLAITGIAAVAVAAGFGITQFAFAMLGGAEAARKFNFEMEKTKMLDNRITHARQLRFSAEVDEINNMGDPFEKEERIKQRILETEKNIKGTRKAMEVQQKKMNRFSEMAIYLENVHYIKYKAVHDQKAGLLDLMTKELSMLKQMGRDAKEGADKAREKLDIQKLINKERLKEMAIKVRENNETEGEKLGRGLMQLKQMLDAGVIDQALHDMEAARLRQERWSSEIARAKSITEQYQTPLEKYRETVKELKMFLDFGFISQVTFNKALGDAIETMRKAQDPDFEKRKRRAEALTKQGETDADKFKKRFFEIRQLLNEGLITDDTASKALMKLYDDLDKLAEKAIIKIDVEGAGVGTVTAITGSAIGDRIANLREAEKARLEREQKIRAFKANIEKGFIVGKNDPKAMGFAAADNDSKELLEDIRDNTAEKIIIEEVSLV